MSCYTLSLSCFSLSLIYVHIHLGSLPITDVFKSAWRCRSGYTSQCLLQYQCVLTFPTRAVNTQTAHTTHTTSGSDWVKDQTESNWVSSEDIFKLPQLSERLLHIKNARLSRHTITSLHSRLMKDDYLPLAWKKSFLYKVPCVECHCRSLALIIIACFSVTLFILYFHEQVSRLGLRSKWKPIECDILEPD